jgi:serine phosphatase RsbU (regulator of sigma subunit)
MIVFGRGTQRKNSIVSSSTNLDPVLQRQLKKIGALDTNTAPTSELWAKFIAAVNDHYKHLNEDRALLTRSMELSTAEMEELRRRVETQRDQLKAIVDVIGEALGIFGGIVREDTAQTHDVAAGLEYAKSQFSARIQAVFGDESSAESSQISGIRSNLVNLADQLIRLLHETAEKASLKKEFEVARTVQSLLVPTEDIIDRPFLRVAAYFQPASECGGDWWTVSDLPDERVLFLIGDVTGHGISSAIITGAAKASCALACHVTKGQVTPSELLGMMNAAIHETARRQIMMTCAAAVFDRPRGQLIVANAGHHFPYLLRDGQLRPIMVHGQPLGATSGTSYESTVIPFMSKDLVVWFTDGVVECENEWGEQFSDKRLRAICQRAAAAGAQGVRDAVVQAISAFREHRPQTDDMTLVVASIK